MNSRAGPRTSTPATGYWGPLEPDLVGEHLVATTLTLHCPTSYAGVLTAANPRGRQSNRWTSTPAPHPTIPTLASGLGSECSAISLAGLCELAVAAGRRAKPTLS